jgi:meso-butanediol dehydrogenase / (S,S)-butanediol dehydrogenase / diacetyl reductase
MQFSVYGAIIVLAARNLSQLQKVSKKVIAYGGDALIIPADVTCHRDCCHLIDETLEVYGTIDIMLNNAVLCVPVLWRSILMSLNG